MTRWWAVVAHLGREPGRAWKSKEEARWAEPIDSRKYDPKLV
jgi:hypothetical protein